MPKSYHKSMSLIPNDFIRSKIDTIADYVARNGDHLEAVIMEKQQNNAEFNFIFGGPFHEYYRNRVNEIRNNIANFWSNNPNNVNMMNQIQQTKIDYNTIMNEFLEVVKDYSITRLQAFRLKYIDVKNNFNVQEILTYLNKSENNYFEFKICCIRLLTNCIFTSINENNQYIYNWLYSCLIPSLVDISKFIQNNEQKTQLLSVVDIWQSQLSLIIPEEIYNNISISGPDFKLKFPAGLMVKYIDIGDCEYAPLDQDTMDLNLTEPPSEKLLIEIERFYSKDYKCDGMGWEIDSLSEYYKNKLPHKKTENTPSQTNKTELVSTRTKFTD